MSKEVVYKTPLPEQGSFHDWSQRFQDRQEVVNQPYQNVEYDFFAPIVINLIADGHIGHPATDYKRLEQEADEIVQTPNSFVFLLGDMINNMNWNPGQMEEMEQTPEQIEYFRSYMDYLASYQKLLLVVRGDHDGWLLKSGFDMLAEASERYGAHATAGVTQVKANVGAQEYKVGVAHQLPGHSMYNKTHPQVRAERFGGLRGADVIASAHNHGKGYSTDWQQNFDGTHQTHYVALGAYKPTDGWLAKKGFKMQDPEQMYGAAVRLDRDSDHIVYYDDILTANKEHRE
ncbi:MAG: hypothetical protein DRP09_11085 [Candidatus Thorarchaeota archaeon]|nr:MAG: hypothetical protein DRP09_11085 [Candidatus Thorarchaeota archaeon]